MFLRTFIFVGLFLFAEISRGQNSSADPGCYAGAYRNEKGDILTLSAEPEKSGWRFFLLDGRTGLLRRGHDDAFTAGPGWSEEKPVLADAALGLCNAPSINFTLKDGPSGIWHRIPLRVTDTYFDVAGARLAGRLIEPAETGSWPLVVTVHGSEQYSAIKYYSWSWITAAQGVAVFVYDKRGTGGSSGTFTMDFDVLADDAAAALRTARQLADKRISRAGFFGGSQGGLHRNWLWLGRITA